MVTDSLCILEQRDATFLKARLKYVHVKAHFNTHKTTRFLFTVYRSKESKNKHLLRKLRDIALDRIVACDEPLNIAVDS